MVWGVVARGVLGRIFGSVASTATTAGIVYTGANWAVNTLRETFNADPAKAVGIGAAVAIGTSVLNNAIGTPLALVASLATALYFNNEIGQAATAIRQAIAPTTTPTTQGPAPG